MKLVSTNFSVKICIGIDIHKRDWKIHAVTAICTAISFTCPPHIHALQKWVENNYKVHDVPCAYEAEYNGHENHIAIYRLWMA